MEDYEELVINLSSASGTDTAEEGTGEEQDPIPLEPIPGTSAVRQS